MFDLMVVARGGRWVLVDEAVGELGAYSSRAEALRAASSYDGCVGEEHRFVLICEEHGEWEEAVLEIPRLH